LRCLVTGIDGFLGRPLAEELIKNNYSVIGIDKNNSSNNKYISYTADISNWVELDALQINEPVDFIIHLAALTDPNTDRNLMYNVNVRGTENICLLGQKLKIQKIIYISTVSVYSSFNLKYIDESTPVNPVNYYGEIKLAAEKIIQSSGINFTILRPTNIFGIPGDKYANYFHKIKYRGKRLGIVFYYNRNTHLLYLYDLIDVIKTCIQNSASDGQIFIVSDDENNTFEKNILSETIKILGIKKTLLPYPLFWRNKDSRAFSSGNLTRILKFKIRYGVNAGLKRYLRVI